MRAKYNETYGEIVEVKGIQCEFYDLRIDEKSVPEGKFLYEVRHDEEDWGLPCQVQKGVLVNFYGTIISDTELPVDEEGRLYLEENDFKYIYF